MVTLNFAPSPTVLGKKASVPPPVFVNTNVVGAEILDIDPHWSVYIAAATKLASSLTAVQPVGQVYLRVILNVTELPCGISSNCPSKSKSLMPPVAALANWLPLTVIGVPLIPPLKVTAFPPRVTLSAI